GAAEPLELGEQLTPFVELLDDRLDYQGTAGRLREGGRGREPCHRALALLLGALPLVDLARQEVADAPRRLLAQLVGDLAPDDVESRLDRHLRDPGAHRAEADDADRPYVPHLAHRARMLVERAREPPCNR